MARNAVAMLLGCVYVAGSTWLVLGEGKTYRETLRRERLAEARPDVKPPSPTPAKSAVSDASIVTKPTPVRSELARKDSAASDASSSPAQPARAESHPAPPTTAVVAASATSMPTTPAKAARTPRPSNARGPLAAAVNGFWDEPRLKQAWDLAHLSVQEEARLGAELHGLILHLNERSPTGPWLRRVAEAAEPFLEGCERKDVSYTFTVLESDAVCAFSHPGGYVYVCRGLFDLIGDDEDYALEFAVGHEIAHVDLQHALQSLRDPGVVKVPMGTLQKLYMIIIPFAYLDDAEFQADRWAYSRMRRAGRTERECLAFLRKLEGYAKRNGFEDGRIQPKPAVESSLLDNHYRAHTATWDRVKHLKAFIATAAGPKK